MRWSFSTPADQHDARRDSFAGEPSGPRRPEPRPAFRRQNPGPLRSVQRRTLAVLWFVSRCLGSEAGGEWIRKYDHCRHPKNQGKKRRRILALVHHRGDGLRRRQIGNPASLLFNEWLRNYGRQVHRHVTWFCTFFFLFYKSDGPDRRWRSTTWELWWSSNREIRNLLPELSPREVKSRSSFF